MDISEPAIDLSARLKDVSIKNTALTIYNRVNSVKQKGDDRETINTLEEIINDLIADKNELVHISSCYEQEFAARQVSDSDIEYITKELVPIIATFIPLSDPDNLIFQSVEKIISSETLKILQLLGFNYKEAIGIPLTRLVSDAIHNQTNKMGSPKGAAHKRNSPFKPSVD